MIVKEAPKLVLNKETLRILTDPRIPQDPAGEMMHPRSRPVAAVATCYSCYATCTC